jgi:hypothetical protein
MNKLPSQRLSLHIEELHCIGQINKVTQTHLLYILLLLDLAQGSH